MREHLPIIVFALVAATIVGAVSTWIFMAKFGGAVKVGDTVYVKARWGYTYVTMSEEVCEDFSRASTMERNALLMTPLVFKVYNGTRCSVIPKLSHEKNKQLVSIMILTGPHSSKEGYLPKEELSKSP